MPVTGTELERILRQYRLELVRRDECVLRRPKRTPSAMRIPAPRTYVHHAATEGADNCAELRVHQAYHMDSKGWNDIAYSLALPDPNPDRLVFECRGIGIAGGHTLNENTESHGLLVMCNCQRDRPSQNTIDALEDLLVCGQRNGWWSADEATILGHRNAPGASTSCPGDHLYARLPEIRRNVAAGGTPPPPPPPPPTPIGLDMASFFFRAPGKEWALYDGGVYVDLPYQQSSALANEFITAIDLAARHATGKILLRREVSPACYAYIQAAAQNKRDQAPGFVARISETGERVWVGADRLGKISESVNPDEFAAIVWVVTAQGFDLTPATYSAEQLKDIPELSTEVPEQAPQPTG